MRRGIAQSAAVDVKGRLPFYHDGINGSPNFGIGELPDVARVAGVWRQDIVRIKWRYRHGGIATDDAGDFIERLHPRIICGGERFADDGSQAGLRLGGGDLTSLAGLREAGCQLFNPPVPQAESQTVLPICGSTISTMTRNLRRVAVVEATRAVVRGQVSTERRYYLTSLPAQADRWAGAVRGHWPVENCVHWVLDVQLGEDANGLRQTNAVQNLARLRAFTLNIRRRDQTHKVGGRAQQKAAGWSSRYLLHLLNF